MISLLIFTAGFMLGGIAGIFLMALVQINGGKDDEL